MTEKINKIVSKVGTKKQISEYLNQKVKNEKVNKNLLSRKTSINKLTLYGILDCKKNYTIDNLLKVCNELNIQIYID